MEAHRASTVHHDGTDADAYAHDHHDVEEQNENTPPMPMELEAPGSGTHTPTSRTRPRSAAFTLPDRRVVNTPSSLRRPKSAAVSRLPPPKIEFGTIDFLRHKSKGRFTDKSAHLLWRVSRETGYKGRLAEALSGETNFRPLPSRPATAKRIASRAQSAKAESGRPPKNASKVHSGLPVRPRSTMDKHSNVKTEVCLHATLEYFRQSLRTPNWKSSRAKLVQLPVCNLPFDDRGCSAPPGPSSKRPLSALENTPGQVRCQSAVPALRGWPSRDFLMPPKAPDFDLDYSDDGDADINANDDGRVEVSAQVETIINFGSSVASSELGSARTADVDETNTFMTFVPETGSWIPSTGTSDVAASLETEPDRLTLGEVEATEVESRKRGFKQIFFERVRDTNPGDTNEMITARTAYVERCLQNKLPPAPLMFGRPDLTHVDLTGFGMNGPVATALACGVELTPTLKSLSLGGNPIGDDGLVAICNALRMHYGLEELDISQTRIRGVPKSLLEIIDKTKTLRTFNMSGVTMGLTHFQRLLASLRRSKTVAKVNLSKNSMMGKTGVYLKELLEHNTTISELDLSWNCLGTADNSAIRMCEGLMQNRGLTKLNLSWNAFGAPETMKVLMNALTSGSVRLKHLDLSYNRIRDKGSIIISESLEHMKEPLEMFIVDGNSLGRLGGRLLWRTYVSVCVDTWEGMKRDRTLEEADYDKKREREAQFRQMHGTMDEMPPRPTFRPLPKRPELSMKGCSVDIVDSAIFDPVNPAGRYAMDLKDGYNRTTVKFLIRLAMAGKGEFIPSSTYLDGSPIAAWKYESDVPVKGAYKFQFASIRGPPTEADILPDSALHFLLNLIDLGSDVDVEHLIKMSTSSDTFLSPEQLLRLMEKLWDKPNERIRLLTRTLHRIIPGPTGIPKVLASITAKERTTLFNKLSPSALYYTADNPTGRYTINLEIESDREVALRLVEQRVEMYKKFPQPATKPEAVFCNLRYQGKPFRIAANWAVPYTGMVEMDFVSISHPGPLAKRIRTWELDDKIELLTSVIDKLPVLRDICCKYYLSCAQAMRVLKSIDADVPSKQTFLVLVYSRLVDWVGFNWLISKSLWPTEIGVVHWRLGRHNVFERLAAIDCYELNLTHEYDRWVTAQLLELAIDEPGENMLHTLLDGLSFTVPSHWDEKVPSKGEFVVYYCRNRNVISKILREAEPRSIPHNYHGFQRPNADWVNAARNKKIKDKLAKSFPDPVECFHLVDVEGDGSISRMEFSRFLRANDLELQPHEMKDLMEALDEDGSGEIEMDELVGWWESTLDDGGDILVDSDSEDESGIDKDTKDKPDNIPDNDQNSQIDSGRLQSPTTNLPISGQTP